MTQETFMWALILQSVCTDDERKDTHKKPVYGDSCREGCRARYAGLQDAEGSRNNIGKHVAQGDGREDELWLKRNGMMLTDDKEKIELHNCFFPKSLLLLLLFLFFFCIVAVPLKKELKIFRQTFVALAM